MMILGNKGQAALDYQEGESLTQTKTGSTSSLYKLQSFKGLTKNNPYSQ